MDELIRSGFKHLDQFMIIFAISIFVIHMAMSIFKKSSSSLEGAVLKSLTAAGIPNGIAFIVCGLMPEYVPLLQGATLAYALAGLAMIYVSVKDVLRLYA